ncbi:putative metallophosphoesterase At3g03305 isoform X2 [Ananas comosus]|nr:putative metallophosphoesterase At3g03305 isoform X2 [Ananas comosus]XP_020104397.1 putative metallophosphoesterase At3g03305 isoform X2 [Ananas comosus]
MRASFAVEGDVAWAVQISDLHVSAHHPARARDLVRLLAPALRLLRPSLLLITGDLTDAKNKKRTSTRQDEYEWILYRNSMDEVVKQSGLDKHRIFDIRGNHDKYGVPFVGHKMDFFSTHSINSQLNRLSTIYSISLLGNDRRYLFIGIDDTMSIGIRGPSNLFGHPTDKRIDVVESELQYWDNSTALITKVVFGHFPMSFTASSKTGTRYENVFSRQQVSAYICGHLHAKLSKKLWRLHKVETASNSRDRKRVHNFWEWELGDWKESKLIRILALDGEAVSFLDLELEQEFPTTILITYPTNSRSMNTITTDRHSIRNDISALVFSHHIILNVTAKVFDSSRNFKIVEEIPLQLVTSSSSTVYKPLFHAKWNAESYKSTSPTRYWVQVFALDSQGKQILSEPRPFSVDGKLVTPSRSWLNYLVFEIRWEILYSVLLRSNLGFLILMLLSKFLNHFWERNMSYGKWAMSVFSSPIHKRKLSFWVLWFLIEGSRNRIFWLSIAVYLLWLIKMPWFWGYATSEEGEIGVMYLSGWKLKAPNNPVVVDKLASPDIMVIALPVMYLVVTPVIVITYALFAERSAFHFSGSRKSKCLRSPVNLNTESKQHSAKIESFVFTCGGGARKILLFLCMIITLVHFKICTALMWAYGAAPVALSPALCWVPPLLLVAAVYSTATTAE